MNKPRLYALSGFVLGWGSPLGALFLRLIGPDPPVSLSQFLAREWSQNAVFYLYMLVGTCAVLSVTGYLLGQYEENLRLRDMRKVDLGLQDYLTGLVSHTAMHKLFSRHFQRHRDMGTPISCLMLDLDHFRDINNAYGHAFGDVVLGEFAQTFRSCVRDGDTAARYDGEEFLCILPDCDADQARLIAERIRGRTEDMVFPLGNNPIRLTVSIGGMTLKDVRRPDYRSMIEESHRNLIGAKNQGRNRTILTAVPVKTQAQSRIRAAS